MIEASNYTAECRTVHEINHAEQQRQQQQLTDVMATWSLHHRRLSVIALSMDTRVMLVKRRVKVTI